MGVHVDETGGDDPAVSLYNALRPLFELADGDDSTVADADVGLDTGGARAVNHNAPHDRTIQHWPTSLLYLITIIDLSPRRFL